MATTVVEVVVVPREGAAVVVGAAVVEDDVVEDDVVEDDVVAAPRARISYVPGE